MTAGIAADLWPLAEAKLAAPRQRAGLVDRPRILQVLDDGADAALTLVAAPPGFGKSTAVRTWCASRSEPLAWVTLDARDNDPVRLWTYIATAVDRIRTGLGRTTLRRLGAAAVVAGPIDELLNRIGGFGRELVIVLDDLQTVTDRDALASIDYAVEHLPANARLIVITRIDPALGLARLRAGGALAELRADELAFTVAEARELLVERGKVRIGDGEVELLHARTEGWPAALVLATLWLRRVPDPLAAVREFGGDQHFVADYLLSEVIGSLDADVRPFVLRAAVLRRFTPELCDGVLDRSDSASLLAELERSNQFLVRIEHGGWYRVHSLLAELAEMQLAAREPGAVAETHRRAARWLRSKGLAVEAVDHAIAAGDHELLAELLVEHHLALIRNGGARTLLRCVETLPAELVVANPELAVGAATAATMIGQAVERRRLLHLARRAEAEHPERCTPYVRAVAGMVRAAAVDTDVAEAVREGRRAVAIAEADADPALVAALVAWLADRPGDMVVTLDGYQYQVSLMAAAAGHTGLVAAMMLTWWLIKSIWNSPYTIARHFRARRRDRGYQALSTGIIAAGAGDAAKARQMNKQAAKLINADQEPLIHLLEAQSLALEGNVEGAREKYEYDDRRPGDASARPARSLISRRSAWETKRPPATTPHAPPTSRRNWFGHPSPPSKSHVEDGDWDGALELPGRAERHHRPRNGEPPPRRFTDRQGDGDVRHRPCWRSYRRAGSEPSARRPLPPAAVIAARALFRDDETRKGAKLLEAAWKRSRSGRWETFTAHARPGDATLDRARTARGS